MVKQLCSVLLCAALFCCALLGRAAKRFSPAPIMLRAKDQVGRTTTAGTGLIFSACPYGRAFGHFGGGDDDDGDGYGHLALWFVRRTA